MTKTNSEIATEEKLMDSLETMHVLASGSLSRIRGIAKCILAALETEHAVNDFEAIAEALQAIVLDADMTHNDIGCEAENHGIQTTCPRWKKRLDAHSKAIHGNTDTAMSESRAA